MVATTWPERGSTFWIRSSASCHQIFAVEGGAGVGGDGELANQRAALGIQRGDAPAAGEPNVRAVEGHAVNPVYARKRAVFAEDLRLPGLIFERRSHGRRLLDGQRAWE